MSGDTLDATFERILRMLGDPITVSFALRSLEAIGTTEGIPPRFAEQMESALSEAKQRSRGDAELLSVEEAIDQLPELERRGCEREAARERVASVAATLEWLHRHMGSQWRADDASDLLRYMMSVDAASLLAGEEPVRLKERTAMAREFLLRPRYVNHCWHCQTEINSRFDARCPDCERYYVCSKCRRCFHHHPNAPSVSDLRADVSRVHVQSRD